MIEIRPNPGPQEAFLSCPADICIFGGAAGSSKSFGLLLEGARILSCRGGSGTIFRRTSVQLTGPGSLWEDSKDIYPSMGCTRRESPVLEWRSEKAGSMLEFRHLQHEKDVESQQGKQPILVGFDELTHFTERQFWYLVSRLRSGRMSGFRPYMRATCNPDPDSFVRQLIDWWIGPEGYAIQERSGVIRWFVRMDDTLQWFDSRDEAIAAFQHMPQEDVLPLSFTFIAAKLTDNPKLIANDPTYRAKLLALPEVERERLLNGNWNIRPTAGRVFRPREWCEFVDAVTEPLVLLVRCWDLAGTKPTTANRNPDYTRCVLWGKGQSGQLYLMDGAGWQEPPGTIRDHIRAYAAADGVGVVQALWQDPAQAGKDQAQQIRRELQRVPVRTRAESKTKHTAMAPAIASQMEHGNVTIVRGPWVDSFCGELQGFPDGEHDDWVAAICRGWYEVASPLRVDGYRGEGHQPREEGRVPMSRGVPRASRGIVV